MKKFLITGIALAMLAIPATASADVPRCGATITDDATATFRMTETRGEGGQWYSDFTVKVAANGTIISGVVDVYGFDGGVRLTGTENNWAEVVIPGGTITQDAGVNYATLEVSRDFNRIAGYKLVNAVLDPTAGNTKFTYPTEFNPAITLTVPVMTAATTTDMNHGEYVSSVGGGKAAGQACKGMPLKSTQGTK
jgi:hypothetical protein